MSSTGLVIHLQKGDYLLLGTQTCLGAWMLVTKALGTHMAFFLVLLTGKPINLAHTTPFESFLRT
jgi:hypothetical protein